MLSFQFLLFIGQRASQFNISEWAFNEVISDTDFYLWWDMELECLGNEMAHSILKHGT